MDKKKYTFYYTLEKKKNKKKEYIKYFIEFVTIAISIIAIAFSFISNQNSKEANTLSEKVYQETVEEKKPNLKIIQNLWTEKPRYELINESSSKLDETPSPSYIMLIPSKLYFHFDNGERSSILILTPIPYNIIEEQIVGNQTNESIVTTYLPSNFYGKKGIQDFVNGDVLSATEDGLKMSVSTYPFMIIISDVTYKYKNNYHQKIILSTPLINDELDREQYNNIREYINDTAQFLKIDFSKDESIYQTVQKNVEKSVSKLNETQLPDSNDQNLFKIIGGKEGGYGNILKDLNSLITPVDPFEDYQNRKK